MSKKQPENRIVPQKQNVPDVRTKVRVSEHLPTQSEYTFRRQLKTWLFKKSFAEIIV